MQLFELGDFKLHSGERSIWKIDCDALTNDEIKNLAIIMRIELLPPFGSVEGVPRGGLRLAKALKPAISPGHPLLIVDDVYTTGASMEAHRAGRDAIGVVIFARRPVKQPWITAVFTMGAKIR